MHPLWEEHALYSDADIRGEFDFGPYRLMTTFATGVGIGRVSHQLVLRHADHLLEAPVGAGTIDHSDTAGWTGGELGDQMAALLSLSLGSRVRSGGVVRPDGAASSIVVSMQPHTPHSGDVDWSLVAGS